MDPVKQIFSAFGSQSELARRIHAPITTVNVWHSKLVIPHWRRRDILDAAISLASPLPAGALEYLSELPPKRAA